jgi:hypothetical protein
MSRRARQSGVDRRTFLLGSGAAAGCGVAAMTLPGAGVAGGVTAASVFGFEKMVNGFWRAARN